MKPPREHIWPRQQLCKPNNYLPLPHLHIMKLQQSQHTVFVHVFGFVARFDSRQFVSRLLCNKPKMENTRTTAAVTEASGLILQNTDS